MVGDSLVPLAQPRVLYRSWPPYSGVKNEMVQYTVDRVLRSRTIGVEFSTSAQYYLTVGYYALINLASLVAPGTIGTVRVTYICE